MSKKYYVERKADNVWVVAAEDGSDSQEFNDQGRAIRHSIKMNAPAQLQAAIDFISNIDHPNVTLDDELRFAADELYNLRRYGRETLCQGLLAVLYADHATTELQAENAQLRARVAELEAACDQRAAHEYKLMGEVAEPKAIQVGTVEKPQIKPLRRHIGEADNGTTKLVVTVGAIANTPIIEHPDGRIWSISWNEIIELAVKAFDKEGGAS